MKTLTEIIDEIKLWRKQWNIQPCFVSPIRGERDFIEALTHIDNLIGELEGLQGILSDCQQESGAFAIGYEQGKSESREGILLALLKRCLEELVTHNSEYHHVTPKDFFTELRVILGIAEVKKASGSCQHCHERDVVEGDKDKRCSVCIAAGWVRGRRGWRQLGDYDS